MKAHPVVLRSRERIDQPTLAGIIAPLNAPAGTVEPQPNGTAKLLFDGDCRGVYPNEEKAATALRTFRNAGLCT